MAVACALPLLVEPGWPHWALIAVGIPLVGYVTYENGPWIGLLVLAAGMSVLRWPVIYLTRWLRRIR